MAEALTDKVMGVAGISRLRPCWTLRGQRILRTDDRPAPLLENVESVVLNGDHVTLDAGSGCVHTAPGFGADDYFIYQTYDRTARPTSAWCP